MPNWCTNHWDIHGSKEDVQQVREILTHTITEDGVTKEEVTFNKLIPMPAILRNIHKGFTTIDGVRHDYWIEEGTGADGKPVQRALTDEEHAEIGKIGYPSWYEWSSDKWGTKWDACRGEIQMQSDGVLSLQFDTAWAPPEPVAKELVKRFPNIALTANYVDEYDGEYHNLM